MTDIVKHESAQMVQGLAESDLTITDEQLDLVRDTVAPGADDANLKLYLYDCLRLNVHPLDKLIHYTQHFDSRAGRQKYTPVVSIDYMRIRAESSGCYAGQDDPIFTREPRKGEGEEAVAKVTVFKIVGGLRCGFTGVARWFEFAVEGPQGMMWRKMPMHMLAKCAEAQALRKAFPGQLSGLYFEGEMAKAGEPAKEVEDTATADVAAALGHTPEPVEKPPPATDPMEQWEKDQGLL